MLDKPTIEKLQLDNALSQVNKELASQGVPMVTGTPNTVSIYDLEEYMPLKRRFDLRYRTSNIDSFVDYVSMYNRGDESRVFVHDQSLSGVCVVDVGNDTMPLHMQHSAALELRKTATFQAIWQMSVEIVSQKHAGQWLEDNQHDIVAITSKDGLPMTVNEAAQSLYNITIEAARNINSKVSDFGYEASALEKVEAKSENQIPAFITFTSPLYVGLQPRDITLRVSIITSDERPRVSFRMARAEQLQDDSVSEFAQLLGDRLIDTGVPLFIGKV